MAIAGGRTLQDLCGQIKDPGPRSSLIVVQAMGNVGYMPSPYDALELGRQLAAKWHGSFFMLNTPVLLPTPETRDAIMSLEENKQVVSRFSDCDLALVGVGTLQNSVFTDRGIFKESDTRDLRKCGAVGEVCGRLFDAEGHECDSSFKDRVASISLEQLRAIPLVIAVTVGADRAAALHAAITGGIVKSVVIDDAGATALLQQAGVTAGPETVKV
jgi:DNA-binding transcriptional regulator LsrR (DeoR family)